jgi:succinate dehydrogenase / fumarate reductase flavoprotein subunit/fumarate reductase flavoprotein subunit
VTTLPTPEVITVDVAILGTGAAGLMAARHVAASDPGLRVALVSKGLVGRSGCSIMALGINAALGADDAPAIHLDDIIRAGAFLSDQGLAAAVAEDAPSVIRELADELGCAFDRTADGTVRLSPFAGQSRDRKISHGHLTGLEIMNRLRDDLLRTRPLELTDHRALDLLIDDGGVCGVVVLDVRSGRPIVLATTVVILATGGSAAASYRVATPAREKSGDGLAMALRAGLPLRDMEMVQFLSVGLAAGGSKITGTLLEEALRFAGATLLDAHGDRFMLRHDPDRAERASRDVVAAAAYATIRDGKGTPDGAVLLDCRPIGGATLAERFGDIVARIRLAGIDPATEPVPIAPAAHIGIGGVVIDEHAQTELPGLLVAGEDAGGVHGASWTGGNGIAESTVFGRRAGRRAAGLARERGTARPSVSAAHAVVARVSKPLAGRADGSARPAGASPWVLADELRSLAWDHVGLRRDEAGLELAADRIAVMREAAEGIRVDGPPGSNAAWQETLDLHSRLATIEAVVAAARARTETRGVHIRRDHPARDDAAWLRTIVVRGRPGSLTTTTDPVVFDRLAPDVPRVGEAR